MVGHAFDDCLVDGGHCSLKLAVGVGQKVPNHHPGEVDCHTFQFLIWIIFSKPIKVGPCVFVPELIAMVVEVPEPMPIGQQILGSIGDLLVGGKEICALVVLKHCSMDLTLLQGLAAWVGLLDN